MLAVLLLCLLPQQTEGDLNLEPVKVSLGAEPGTARTEALLELLRTRFLEVELNADGADLWVIDSPTAFGDGERYFSFWRPYAPVGFGASFGPRVFLGAAVPRAIEFFGFVGAEPAIARVETIASLGHPAAPSAPDEWSASALLGAHTPLAFALEQSPDVEVVWGAEDEHGRPVAVVWQQHRYLFFAPTGSPAELGEDGRAALLDTVAFAARLSTYEGQIVSKGAPGENASAELSWWLGRETVDLARCRELLSEDLADVAADVPSLRSWHADRGFALLADDAGRLVVDPDLEEFGSPASDEDFVERVLGALEATALAERDLARRLLARHVAGGPGTYASAAEWRQWLGRSAAYLVFCHPESRWHVDYAARENGVPPGSWPPSLRPRGRLTLDDAPAGASPEEIVAWLLSIDPEDRRYRGGLDPALAQVVAVPLLAAWESTAHAPKRPTIEHWIENLGRATSRIAVPLHASLERRPLGNLVELRAIADARPVDAEPLVRALAKVARARQFHDFRPEGWERWHPLARFAPNIARAIDASNNASQAAGLVVDLAIDSVSGKRVLAADALALVAANCGSIRPEDRERLLDVLSEKAYMEAETVAPTTLAKLVQASGETRWIETLDALLDRSRASGRSMIDELAPAYLHLGPMGIARFERVLGDAVGLEHARLLGALARSEHIDDAWLETCLEDKNRRTLAYAVLGQSPERWERWAGRLREAAVGADPDEAVLAVASLGNLAERLREAVPPLAEALAHASPWVRRGAAFELGSPYRDVRAAEAALVRALDDTDRWVRHLAAWALREPSGVGEDAAARRLREIAAGDGVLAVVARDALQRRSPDPAWLVRKLRAVRPHQVLDDALSLATATPGLRWKAAQNLALSDEGGALLDRLLDADPVERSAADETVRRIEHELRDWLDHLCEVLDGEFYGGPATDEFSGLGPVGIAHLEHELMRPYRFPIGSASYTELVIALERIGGPAWPVLAASIWHWRGHGLTDTAPAWESVARDSAQMLAPLLAMRLARDSALRCSFEWYADSRSEEVVARYLLPMWEALGAEGEAALDELAKHPLADVRAAAARVRP